MVMLIGLRKLAKIVDITYFDAIWWSFSMHIRSNVAKGAMSDMIPFSMYTWLKSKLQLVAFTRYLIKKWKFARNSLASCGQFSRQWAVGTSSTYINYEEFL